MNPLTSIPPRIRQVAYTVVTLAALVYGAWEAADGNWSVFVGSLITSATTLLAAANVDVNDPGEDGAVDLGSIIGLLVVVILLFVLLRLLGLL